jgi:hypothetical protein
MNVGSRYLDLYFMAGLFTSTSTSWQVSLP